MNREILTNGSYKETGLQPDPVAGLARYYASRGVSEDAWHIGPEHPGLEQLGLRLLGTTGGARILEIGVQSGGFSVPVILAAAGRADFSYTGVDNLEYTNAVPLRLISDYLEGYGAARDVRFIEGDSTAVLRSAAASSYDFILLDHYKPKYPIDLALIFERGLLRPNAVVVLHDVLTHAAKPWKSCERLCRAFGYTWTIDSGLLNGAAVVRRDPTCSRSAMMSIVTRIEVTVRWQAHASLLRCRRAVGTLLRKAQLR